ncbi:hypothetical protein GCM10010269_55440 [Streptomyces humidus]|uniref:Uncharacterized protein n=1 Tax=Streptomyces humidus TaxID=52259 RepID=A0A918G0G7_9ACTN|nr:hypothetical protein GCM10010269_55440 [Streptomyces humidus]
MIRSCASSVMTSDPATGAGSPASLAGSQERRAVSWCPSTTPVGRNEKPGNRACTAVTEAAICSWPTASARGSVYRPSSTHAASTALAKASGSRAFQASKQRATAFP